MREGAGTSPPGDFGAGLAEREKTVSIHPEAGSPAVVVGDLHNHYHYYEEDAGSKPFPSIGVLGIEENNVSEGDRGNEPGERQGNFSERRGSGTGG